MIWCALFSVYVTQMNSSKEINKNKETTTFISEFKATISEFERNQKKVIYYGMDVPEAR